MSNRHNLKNVRVNHALALYQLPRRFNRSIIDELLDMTMIEAQKLLQRLVGNGYVKWTGKKNESGKLYEVTERGREIAEIFGEELRRAM